MKFTPSKAEWNASIKSHLSTIPSDLTTSELYVSGSRWNETHLKALRVVAFDNLSQWQLVPDRWLPHPNLKLYKELKEQIQAPARSDLRNWSPSTRTSFTKNTFFDFFEALSEAMTKRENIFNLPTQLQGGSHQSFTEDEESPSSHEDELEELSRAVLQEFARAVERVISKSAAEYGIRVNRSDMPQNLYLGPDHERPQLRKVNNDGGLILVRRNGGQGGIPLVSFECKRRHAGGQHHPTGQPETYNPRTLAQEVAELLGPALAEGRAELKGRGQDAYVLTIHGTQLRIVAAHFTGDYLNRVQSSTMPIEQHLYVRRSGFYELKDPAGRVEALKVVTGLFRYLLSGRAEMAQIRAVANELRKYYG